MKKLFIIGLLGISPLFLCAETYEFYPDSCQEAFAHIDDLVSDPTELKKQYGLSVNALEQVKWSAIEEIEANPDEEEMICGMVAPALEVLIEFKKPKAVPPKTENTLLNQDKIERTLEKSES